jgi:hypothetical protein
MRSCILWKYVLGYKDTLTRPIPLYGVTIYQHAALCFFVPSSTIFSRSCREHDICTGPFNRPASIAIAG